MHMQWGMYHRFDGYEELKPLLEGSDREILDRFEGRPVLIRIPAASTAVAPKARFVSCLLHGNEPSGFQAMVEVLRRGERFPFDLWVLIGNVRAATENGLYADRHLDDQQDFNRVWGLTEDGRTPSTEMERCAAAILDELRDADLEAAVDIHNNSARNPFYAILTELTSSGRQLASLCADTVLFWQLRVDTLMEALAPRCPAVSVECGAPNGAGTEYASDVVHRFLTADGFTGSSVAAEDPASGGMLATRDRITVRPDVSFSFGTALADGDAFVIVPDLDLYNFEVLPALTTIGHVAPGTPMPLAATDMGGRDVTDQLFRIADDGRVIVVDDVIPLMMTTTVVQTRRDCLFYTARLAS